uniref:Uncharacterized protein n=1 Tax=Electrophorus electricus TaxID=8005 RepID=A0A4W4DM80_ELEEL
MTLGGGGGGFFSLSFLVDLHHTILGLHCELLRSKAVDIQADLPALLGLLDLRHARAELAHQGMIHHGGHLDGGGGGRRAHVAGPVAAGEAGQLFREGGNAKGLVGEPAALVPVMEWVPGWRAEEG